VGARALRHFACFFTGVGHGAPEMGLGGTKGDFGCIPEGTLAAFAEGHVDPREHAALEEHLAICSDCRAILARSAGASSPPEAESGPPPSSDANADQLARGTRVGRYVIQTLIGRGAMGAVYSASDPDLARKVAVKLLRAEGWSDDARRRMRARLLREAQSMARLSHPEVITVHDVGPFEDQLFIAMEYIEGCTLRQWRAKEHRSVDEILAVYERAGNGLAAAHEAGLVHRDFKPDNVLVGQDGRVRVTDFGLARAVDGVMAMASPLSLDENPERESGDLTMTLTRTGTLLGTPAYMAPEQLDGKTADARSDVFSFCTALHEALYGERPFAAATVATLRAAIARGDVRPPPIGSTVPRWVRAPLLLGLRADPVGRPASMRALLDALRAARARSRLLSRSALGAALGAFVLVAVLAGRSREGGARAMVAASPAALELHSAAVESKTASPAPPDPPLSLLAASTPPETSVAAPARPTPHPARPASHRPAPARSGPDAGAPQVGSNGAYILE
jgi:eukaryotic-like serine/threonine-protein kinase